MMDWLIAIQRWLYGGVTEGLKSTVDLAGLPTMMAAGFLLMAWGLITLIRSRTAILPFHAARALVIVPPYTFTRNPMYLGLLVAYLGGMLATNWAWPLVFLPVVIGVMNGFVIAREERYLRAEFGASYADYCRYVRRWI